MLYPDTRNRLTGALKLLGVAALYALLARFALVYFSANGVVSVIWPPSGLALAALLLGGKRYGYGVFLGAFLANVMAGGVTSGMAATIAAGNTLEALLGAWLLTRDGKFDSSLRSLRDYLRLIVLAGVFGVSASAVIGTGTLLASGYITAETYFQNLIHWWMGDTLGVILIAPLILVWGRTRNDRPDAKRILEAALLLGVTFLVGQMVFFGWLHDAIGLVEKGYWIFLFVTWIAVRSGSYGAVIALVMVAVQALLGAYHGTGYFANDIANAQLLNYWIYMLVLSIVGMALAAYFTEREHTEAILRENEASMRAILDNLPYLAWLKDASGRYIKINRVYADYIRLEDAQQVIGKSDLDLWPEELAEKYRTDDAEVMATRQQKHAEELSFDSSGMHWIETFKTPIIDDNGNVLGTVGFARDITERKQAEEQIHALAFYDALTKLPNRRLLNDRLGKAMAASKRSGRYGAVMFVDLDNFKPLNDAYGHDIGDLLLIEVAQRLTGCVREADTVARFGGDEFVVILSELDSGKVESARQAGVVAEKIRATLAEPYVLKCEQEGNAPVVVEHHCTSSIGVALFINHGASAEEILKYADMAMYQAKETGRNKVHFYGT